MQIAKFLASSALALGMEMAGFVPFNQPPSNPPNPVPPINPTQQPTPQTPGQQPQAELPVPSVPTRGTNPTSPNATTPNSTRPVITNPSAAPSTAVSAAAAARMTRPFAIQSPQMEARLNETTRRLTQMEQHLDMSNQELLKRLGEARQLTGERQNAAFMDVIQQLLQNNAEMHRYLVQSRMGWSGAPDDATDPMNTQTQVVVPDNGQRTQAPNNRQPQTQVPSNNQPPR